MGFKKFAGYAAIVTISILTVMVCGGFGLLWVDHTHHEIYGNEPAQIIEGDTMPQPPQQWQLSEPMWIPVEPVPVGTTFWSDAHDRVTSVELPNYGFGCSVVPQVGSLIFNDVVAEVLVNKLKESNWRWLTGDRPQTYYFTADFAGSPAGPIEGATLSFGLTKCGYARTR